MCAALAGRGEERRWLISSFRFETVAVCRAIAPERAHGVARRVARRADVIARTRPPGTPRCIPWDPIVDAALIRRAHAAGLAVNTWTCDDPTACAELIAWGIDGICTNVPDVALAVRGAVGAQSADAGNTSRTAFGYEVELEPLDVAEVVAVELVRERRLVLDDHVLDVAPLDECSDVRTPPPRNAEPSPRRIGSDAHRAERHHHERVVERRRRARGRSARLPRYVYGLVLSTIVK